MSMFGPLSFIKGSNVFPSSMWGIIDLFRALSALLMIFQSVYLVHDSPFSIVWSFLAYWFSWLGALNLFFFVIIFWNLIISDHIYRALFLYILWSQNISFISYFVNLRNFLGNKPYYIDFLQKSTEYVFFFLTKLRNLIKNCYSWG